MVATDAPVGIAAARKRFVSRGGEKLSAALERFGVDPSGRWCLDAGASTGGFTDCLLKGGAAGVVAVDIGYGQLDWSLRTDPRVTAIERTNARELSAERLPFVPDLVVADLSFISLRAVAPALIRTGTPDAEFIALIKPQFEAGSADVGEGGVVRDPAVWRRVVSEVAAVFRDLGAAPLGLMASPLRGPAGNVEFLLHARGRSRGITLDVDAAIAEGETIA
jgi:23S rRNA (cytidine1920-2'-O)/16S rRNA (cytidine1409-2'-O)-methyltransferase